MRHSRKSSFSHTASELDSIVGIVRRRMRARMRARSSHKSSELIICIERRRPPPLPAFGASNAHHQARRYLFFYSFRGPERGGHTNKHNGTKNTATEPDNRRPPIKTLNTIWNIIHVFGMHGRLERDVIVLRWRRRVQCWRICLFHTASLTGCWNIICGTHAHMGIVFEFKRDPRACVSKRRRRRRRWPLRNLEHALQVSEKRTHAQL